MSAGVNERAEVRARVLHVVRVNIQFNGIAARRDCGDVQSVVAGIILQILICLNSLGTGLRIYKCKIMVGGAAVVGYDVHICCHRRRAGATAAATAAVAGATGAATAAVAVEITDESRGI